MQGRVGDPVCRVRESAWRAGETTIRCYRWATIHTIRAPEALLRWSRPHVREGKGAELFRLLMDENDTAVAEASNDLKCHRDIFRGGNLGHCIKGSLTPL